MQEKGLRGRLKNQSFQLRFILSASIVLSHFHPSLFASILYDGLA